MEDTGLILKYTIERSTFNYTIGLEWQDEDKGAQNGFRFNKHDEHNTNKMKTKKQPMFSSSSSLLIGIFFMQGIQSNLFKWYCFRKM